MTNLKALYLLNDISDNRTQLKNKFKLYDFFRDVIINPHYFTYYVILYQLKLPVAVSYAIFGTFCQILRILQEINFKIKAYSKLYFQSKSYHFFFLLSKSKNLKITPIIK